MMISTKGRYALRFMIDVAQNQGDGYVPLKEAACRQDISEKYLEIIAKALVQNGLLQALRGKGGGYRLEKAPEEYSLRELLEATDGSLAPVACLEDGERGCARQAQCPTLSFWQGLERVIYEYTERFTLADLMDHGMPIKL
ncbi:MAG: Rrf2 family transcriptional regulator [Oscillospiraceae bacterium]